jgi:hypothetical protein
LGLLLFAELEQLGNSLKLNPLFYCQNCSVLVASGVKSNRFICQTRIVQHPYRSRANLVIRWNEMGKRIEFLIDDPGGSGSQITRECIVCPACARKLKEQQAEKPSREEYEGPCPPEADSLLLDHPAPTGDSPIFP